MKFKSFSLFSSLLVYVAIILFTLGGIRIGETHKPDVFEGLSVSGNTYAGLDVVNQEVHIGGAGSGYTPAEVDGNPTQAFFSLSIKLTCNNAIRLKKPPPPVMLFLNKGGSVYISDGDILFIYMSNTFNTTVGEAELSLYGSMDYSPRQNPGQFIYHIHHHEVKSQCPPDDYETMDNSSNVGAQGPPH